MTDKKTINLINNIKLLLDESIKLHKIYKDNGSKFLYTKKILVINKKILTIIDNKVFLIPNQLKEPFFILKKHITEWIYCWNQNKNCYSHSATSTRCGFTAGNSRRIRQITPFHWK